MVWYFGGFPLSVICVKHAVHESGYLAYRPSLLNYF